MRQSSHRTTDVNREKVKLQQKRVEIQKLRLIKRIERQKKRHQALLNSRR